MLRPSAPTRGKAWENVEPPASTEPFRKSVIELNVSNPYTLGRVAYVLIQFRRTLAPTLKVCWPHIFEKSSINCHCRTFRPCGYALSEPPSWLNGAPSVKAQVVGKVLIALA